MQAYKGRWAEQDPKSESLRNPIVIRSRDLLARRLNLVYNPNLTSHTGLQNINMAAQCMTQSFLGNSIRSAVPTKGKVGARTAHSPIFGTCYSASGTSAA